MPGDTRQRVSSWGWVTVFLLTLLLAGRQVNWRAALNNNTGWLFAVIAIQQPRERASNPVFYDGTNAFVTHDRVDSNVSDNLYVDQISALALFDRPSQYAINWKDAPASQRGLIHLWSAFRFCDQTNHPAASYRGKCEPNIATIGNALLNHPLLPEIHQWDCRQIMDWVVLSQEVDNLQQHVYWQHRLKEQCPDHHSSYLAQDSNGQIQVALAYARLGMYDRAIAVGESLQEDTEWSWGHFIVAGFYSAIDALPEAENQLLEAIAKGEGEVHVWQYYFTLAELYRRQERVQDASYYYCLVLGSEFDSSQTRSLKPMAESSLKEMSGSERAGITELCGQP